MYLTLTTMHLLTAMLCISIALLSIRSMRASRSWQPLPGWSFVAFLSVDALMSLQRAGLPLLPHWHGWFVIGTTLDLIAAALLALVFVQAKRRSRVAVLVVEEARRSADEYDRARRDYEQLVRHRMNNPLAAVTGIARTLDEHPELPEETRRDLMGALIEAADRLAEVSLDPTVRSPEEHELAPVPQLALAG